MEKFNISVSGTGELFNFQVVNTAKESCEYEVYLNNLLVAVFEPDENEYIHICRNPGGLGEEVIVQIAGRIEAHYL
ncbi:MAG: hypothetical protein ACTHNW_19595 [Mucilaginibacter sp.]